MTKKEVMNSYSDFKVLTDFIKTNEDLHIYALGLIEYIDDSIKEYKKELKDNKKMKKEALIRNHIFFIFQEEDISIYDEDNKLIEIIIMEMIKQKEFIKRIIELINKTQKEDLLKLLDFLISNYSSNIDYLEKEREVLEFKVQNIYLSNNNEDNREEISSFIEEMLNKYERNANIIEKKKKI